MSGSPAWLSNWHAALSPTRQPLADTVQRRAINGLGFSEPLPWPLDECQRRESVLDTDYEPPRVVRQVGGQRCLRCRQPFFSEDVVGLGLCPGEGCQ